MIILININHIDNNVIHHHNICTEYATGNIVELWLWVGILNWNFRNLSFTCGLGRGKWGKPGKLWFSFPHRKLGAPNLKPLDLASVFEPFLFAWVDLVKIKASEQVSISMGFTRKTHKELLTRRLSTRSWKSTSSTDWTETAQGCNSIDSWRFGHKTGNKIGTSSGTT